MSNAEIVKKFVPAICWTLALLALCVSVSLFGTLIALKSLIECFGFHPSFVDFRHALMANSYLHLATGLRSYKKKNFLESEVDKYRLDAKKGPEYIGEQLKRLNAFCVKDMIAVLMSLGFILVFKWLAF